NHHNRLIVKYKKMWVIGWAIKTSFSPRFESDSSARNAYSNLRFLYSERLFQFSTTTLAPLQNRVAPWPEDIACIFLSEELHRFIDQQRRLTTHFWLYELLAAFQKGDRVAMRDAIAQANALIVLAADPQLPVTEHLQQQDSLSL
ncbi:MAG: hypothetical protein ABTR07_06065, partial [Candidatus Competibacter denitrificans]